MAHPASRAGWDRRDPPDFAADKTRTAQVTADACTALARGRHRLVLTRWTSHLERLAAALRNAGHDPVMLTAQPRATTQANRPLHPQPLTCREQDHHRRHP